MNEELQLGLATIIKEELKPIINELDSLEKRVINEFDSLEKKVINISKEIEDVREEQQKTNDRLTNIESKQNIIYEQTGKLTEDYKEIMSQFDNLATKEDLSYFDKKITEHDREIFKIKNRA